MINALGRSVLRVAGNDHDDKSVVLAKTGSLRYIETNLMQGLSY